jgi:hypothetical protein
MKKPSRTPTTFAVGFLVLDALLLGYAGVALARPLLVAAGGVFALAAVLAVLGWRRYRRTLAEIDADRKAMLQEVDSIRELLKERHLHN